MTLKDVKPGHSVRIERIKVRGALSKRLLDMGVTPGIVVQVERVAPLGDPIEVRVKGYHLSLRKQEAEGIEVQVLSD